ncbi:MAG: hypothetical protein Q9209_001940 [Squamulea sp. 1 TL-2023]
MRGKNCSPERPYERKLGLFDQSISESQPASLDQWELDLYDRLHQSAMTQPQLPAGSASSSHPTTELNIDLPLGSPKMSKSANTTDEQLQSEPHMRESPPIKLEESGAVGLDIHIPVNRPPYIVVDRPLPCPMPASWYDQDHVFKTLSGPYGYLAEEAEYLRQPNDDELNEVWKPLSQQQTTADRTWSYQQEDEWDDGGDTHGCLHPGFCDSGPCPDVHQTASNELQWADRSHLDEKDPTPSGNYWNAMTHEDIGLFDLDSIVEQWDVGIDDAFLED